MHPFRAALTLVAVALVVVGCGGDTTPTTLHHHVDTEFSFGEPAAASAADRIVEVVAVDTLHFEPEGLTVAVGETVTFRITNAGLLPHDFTLGDQATQDEHEAMMTQMAAGGMTMPDEPNAVTLAAGETKELTWRFTVPGTVLIGCHQPGHFAVGMVATISVGG